MSKNVRLEAIGYLADDGKDVSESSYDRPVMLVYVGKFDSMDGPVEITESHVERLASSHNSLMSKVKHLVTGDIPMRECPPVQLDHSPSAVHTVGRLVGDLKVGEVEIDGEKQKALFGTVRFLGKENVEKAKDGRYTHVSIGADLENHKINELSVTPFPAAPKASLLSKSIIKFVSISDLESKLESLLKKSGISADVGISGQSIAVMVDNQSDATKVKQLLQKTSGVYEVVSETKESDGIIINVRVHASRSNMSRLASHNGVSYEIKEVEPGEYDIVVNGQVVHHHAGTPEEVDQEAKRYIEHEKKEGELKMHEKLKKHLMEHRKLSEKDAEELAHKMTEHHMKHMSMDEEKMSKHLAEAKDEELKRMSDEYDTHMKHLAEKGDAHGGESAGVPEEAEKEKKLSAAKASFITLAKGIKTKNTELAATVKMSAINSRLAKLRAAGKITPAEMKKIDVVKMSSLSAEACEAALSTFDLREHDPLKFGFTSGSVKSDAIEKVARKYRMARLELESRLNMPSKRKEAEAMLSKLAEDEKKELAHVGDGEEMEPSKGMLTKLDYSDLVAMLDDKKRHEELKKHLKHLTDIHGEMIEPHQGDDKKMSALVTEQVELQTKFDELVSLVSPILGIKPEELKF